MVKILVEGKRDKVTCQRCGSYLQFFDSDIRLRKLRYGEYDHDDADDEDKHGAYICCPSCQNSIDVDIPSRMKKQLLESQRNSEFLRDHDI